MEERLRFKLRGAEETDVIANPPSACATATGAAAFYRVTRPPVDAEGMAGDHGGAVRGQEGDRAGHVARLDAPLDRLCQPDLGEVLLGVAFLGARAPGQAGEPLAPSSTASARVKPTTAPLLAM
jgi:hypothetical protein